MNQEIFTKKCAYNLDIIGHQGIDFFKYHELRLYRIYKICKSFLKKGDKVLSVGAGSAYVEGVLAQELDIKVTVLDFAEVIELNKRYYDKLNFEYASCDLHKDELALKTSPFDLILFGDFIEHIPVAPSDLFINLGRLLKHNGHMVISTPNLGIFENIARLILMRPILDPAEKTFVPVCYQNEGIHRRVYMPSELINAMGKADIFHSLTCFIWYHVPKRFIEKILFTIQLLVPRFRPAMIIVGKKL